jgi:hypothetical protein
MAADALREAVRRQGLRTPQHLAFQRRYFNDPVAFVLECIEWKPAQGPAPYQLDGLRAIASEQRVSVRGPHGLGKTAFMAWAVLWFALTRDGLDWKCPTTASNWRQLSKYLWPEIHKWTRRLRWDVIGRPPFDAGGELLDFSLHLSTGMAFALASTDGAALEGAHADYLFYVMDEAKEIDADTWDSVEGAMSAGDCRTLAVSTPGLSSGRFYDIQTHAPAYANWWVMRVTLKQAIEAGRVSEDWARLLATNWGEGSAAYQRHVMGDFAEDDAEAMLPLSWVEAANDRWLAWRDAGFPGAFVCVGVDVGGGTGGDKTTLADYYELEPPHLDGKGQADQEAVEAWETLPYHKGISSVRANANEDTMETVGAVVQVLENKGGKAVVDVIGIGTGVVHRLRELGQQCEAFNASAGTDYRDRTGEVGYANMRAAAWGYMRDLLNPMNDERMALPPDPLLTGDLTAVHTKQMSGGRLRIEEKDLIRKRIGRSTDHGDAVVMAVFGAHITGRRSWLLS